MAENRQGHQDGIYINECQHKTTAYVHRKDIDDYEDESIRVESISPSPYK